MRALPRRSIRMLTAGLLAIVTAALLLAAPVGDGAEARTRRGSSANVLRIGPGDVTTAGDLTSAFLNTSVDTIVLSPGRYEVTGTPLVFGRRGITICSSTGRARDVVIETTAQFALFVDHCENITLRGITLRSTHPAGEAVRLSGSFLGSDSFADGMTIDRCRLEGFLGVRATVRVNDLTVNRTRIDVTQDGGVGLLWEDGEGLFVSRCRFGTDDARASAAIRVRGPVDSASLGERARNVLISRNRVQGDFEFGIELSDVTDARVRSNQVIFPDPVQDDSEGGAKTTENQEGRVGIVIRRVLASFNTEDVGVRGNRVRNALFGAWFQRVSTSDLLRNDFRRCGTSDPDLGSVNTFGLPGGAVLVTLVGAQCRTRMEGNDFRSLRSPTTEAAVVEESGRDISDCAPAGGAVNRVSRGRDLFDTEGGKE